jgi:hypothetical protein
MYLETMNKIRDREKRDERMKKWEKMIREDKTKEKPDKTRQADYAMSLLFIFMP